MAEDAGDHFPVLEFQSAVKWDRSMVPAKRPVLNSEARFSGEEPVSQGRSEVSWRVGRAVNFRPAETEGGKERRQV
jgi:hypothetical protein